MPKFPDLSDATPERPIYLAHPEMVAALPDDALSFTWVPVSECPVAWGRLLETHPLEWL